MKFYAGIGSRGTPVEICQLMTKIAEHMQIAGYTLRSGGANGADKAFEAGAGQMKEIFYARHATCAAIEITSRYHPAWKLCSPMARKLHGRNALIILGSNLETPVNHVICWTKNASGEGGTGQGIRIAKGYSIPVRDLGDPYWLEFYGKLIDSGDRWL